jgi:predicted transposase YdaD
MADGIDFDAALKELFEVDRPSLLRRLARGVKLREFLNVELPRVQMPRADIVVRLADGTILHIEFQSTNSWRIGFRQGFYGLALAEKYRCKVPQIVLYVGRRRLTMPNCLDVGSAIVRYDLMDIRELRAEELMNTGNAADLPLAMLAHGGEAALPGIIERAAQLEGDGRRRLLGQILILSGLRGLPGKVESEMSRMGVVIDARKNPVLMRYLRDAREQGLAEGREQGREEGRAIGQEEGRARGREEGLSRGAIPGRRALLVQLLEARFGTVPRWASDRVARATTAQLDRWGRRVLTAETVDQVLEKR